MKIITLFLILLFKQTFSLPKMSYLCCPKIIDDVFVSFFPFWIQNELTKKYLLNSKTEIQCFMPKTIINNQYYISNDCSLIEMENIDLKTMKNDTNSPKLEILLESRTYSHLLENLLNEIQENSTSAQNIYDNNNLGLILILVAISIVSFILIFICILLFWAFRKKS